MSKSSLKSGAAALVQIAIALEFLVPALPAQTGSYPSVGSTAPPLNWEAKWIGLYGFNRGQNERTENQAPPGFKIVNRPDAFIMGLSQPWALARRDATDFDLEDPAQLCKPTGLFVNVGGGGQGRFELLAAPGKVVLVGMGGGGLQTIGVRRIYLNRPHLRKALLTWNGDSVGHWEGDTLVVDTTGFNDKSWLSGDRVRHSEELHVVERMRLVANDTYLEDKWTVDDPKALKSAYSFTRYVKKQPADSKIEENLCYESPQMKNLWVGRYKDAEKEAEAARAASLQPDLKKK
jgi:hypothetical protein